MISSIRQTPLRLLFLAAAVAVCGGLLLLFNSVPPVEARVKLDFKLDPYNSTPAGVWGNATTIWVANDGGGNNNKIYAYRRSDGSRDPSKDFNSLQAAGNRDPRGIWSDGTTMFVVNNVENSHTFGSIDPDIKKIHDRVYAYKMSDKSRDSGKDIDVGLEGDKEREIYGIWGNESTIWVVNDGEQVKVHNTFTSYNMIHAFKRSDGQQDSSKRITLVFDRDATNDALDDILLANDSNTRPRGIWSDGTTIWVVDPSDQKTYAYKLSDGSRDKSKEFPVRMDDTGNVPGWWSDSRGGGAWSDGETLFLTDNGANKVRAYPLLSRPITLDTTATITLDNSNDKPVGIWGNGETIWVTNDDFSPENKIYAYKRSDGSRDSSKDFNSLDGAGNDNPRGTWSDGTTMYVVDDDDGEIYAYKMSDMSRDAGKDITLDNNNDESNGIWGNSTTIWVVNDDFSPENKIYAYKRSDGSRDSSKDFNTLDGAENDNPRGIWSDDTTMWVVDDEDQRVYAYKMSDMLRDSGKDIVLHSNNADPQGTWSDGEIMYVTDSSDKRVYVYGLRLSFSNSNPKGICGDADTYWLANDDSALGANNKIYAYNRSDGSRDLHKDFDTLSAAGNEHFGGIWCDGQTMYVVDWGDSKIYAYKMVDDPATTDTNEFAQRDTTKDITLYWRNYEPRGIWGNDSTIWVANDGGDKKVFAYRRTDDPNTLENEYGSYDAGSNFETLVAARNWDPRGIWSNGMTMYVVDDEDEKVYAYRLSDKARDPSRDIPLSGANAYPYGLWSDGDILYVTDTDKKLVYYYPFQHPSTGSRPRISGTPRVFEGTVAAQPSASDYTDANGLTEALRFSYQWILSDDGVDTDIKGATERTYTPVLEDVGKRLKVRVRFLDDDGYEEFHTSNASATVFKPTNITATGKPRITGDRTQEGHQLTANVDGIMDENGIPDYVAYSYQWIRRDGGGDTEIEHATGRTYTPVQEDVGEALRVRVNFLDSLAYEESLLSDPLGPVAPEPNKAATGKPTVGGFARAGETLTAHTFDIRDDNGSLDAVVFTYQWIRHEGFNSMDIPGATQSTYRLVGPDVGKQISVKVSFTDIDGYEESRTSDTTDAVLRAVNSDPTGRPAVSGRTVVSRTLTTDTSGIMDDNGLSSAEFSHQWLRRDGGNDSNIAGATRSTYRLVAADEGKQIKVRVTYTDDGGNTETLTSDASGTVLPRPDNTPAAGKPIIISAPKADETLKAKTSGIRDVNIPGVAKVGETLMVDTSGITDENIPGENSLPADVVFSYQWLRSDDGKDSSIAGARQSTYTPVLDDAGKQLKVRVTFTDLHGYQETRTSDATNATIGPIGSGVLIVPGESQRTEGIWGNEETLWVAVEIQTSSGDQARIVAYRRSDSEGDPGKDFSTLHAAGNRNPKGIWSDGVTMFVVDSADSRVYAYTVSDKSRDESKEFELASGHLGARGIWGNATTIWVSKDDSANSILAYSRVDDAGTAGVNEYGTRDSSKDFTTLDDAGNQSPRGILSDGETMWVADGDDGKVYAYSMADRSRQPSKDVDLVSAHSAPAGAWGHGIMLLVADEGNRVFPYDLPLSATGSPSIRGELKVYETLTADTSGIEDPNGIPDDVVYSYQWMRVDGGSVTDIPRAAKASYRLILADENMQIKVRVSFADSAGYDESLTSDPTEMVEPSGCTGVNKPVIVGTPKGGETLTADTSCIRGFLNIADEDLSYSWYWVDDSNDGLSAGERRIGHGPTLQLRYRDEGKQIRVRVSRVLGFNLENRTSETVTVLPGPIRSGFDLTKNGAVRLDGLRGIWGNDDTIWVSKQPAATVRDDPKSPGDESNYALTYTDNLLFAYNRSDGSRAPDKDIRLHVGEDPHLNWAQYNTAPVGIWSDGETMFVVDISDAKIYAYDLDDGSYDPGKDINLASDNNGATGIWGNDSTIWVANVDNRNSLVEKIFAYRRTDGAHDHDKDFNTLDAEGNQLPRGICSDGTTMWVVDSGYREAPAPVYWRSSSGLFAYNMADKSRQTSLEVHGIGNVPRGAWCETGTSGSGTLWIVDRGAKKLYTFDITVGGAVAFEKGATSLHVTPEEKVSEPLTAEFVYEDTQRNHSGAGETNKLVLALSEEVSTTPGELSKALEVSNATVKTVSRVDERGDLLEIRLTPGSDEDVTVLLPPAANCDAEGAICTEDGRMLTYALGTVISGPPPNNAATGAPVISGIVRVGETLVANVAGIADEDGLENAVPSYRWVRNDGTADTHIADAAGVAYTLVSDDEGKTIKVEVSFTDDEGNPETLASDPTGKVVWDAPPEEVLFHREEVTGEGIELIWTSKSDSTETEYVLYRRVLPHESLSEYATVPRSGNSTSFTDADVEPGLEYLYRVTGVNSAGEGPKSDPVRLVVPGERLEAPADLAAVYTEQGMEVTWSAPTNAGITDYQVYRGKFLNDGEALDGAVSKYVMIPADGDPMTYLDTNVEEGAKYRYRVAAVNATGEGFKTTWLDVEATISEADINTQATGQPTITGTALVGETLTADDSGIADGDGLTNVVFSYQWVRNDRTADTYIAEAIGVAYTLVSEDEGKTIKVEVSFTDEAGNEEMRTSEPTNPVAAAAVAAALPTKPLNLTVTRGSQIEELDASWQTPASDGGSDITGYRVQWKEAADSWDTPEDVSEETVTGTTHTIHGLTEGVEYAVRVMATNQVGEGPASAEKTTVPRDIRAPEVVTFRVDGANLRVVYDEALDEGSAPPADAFDVRVACSCDDMTWLDEEAKRAVNLVSVDGDTVMLTLASPATADDYVVVSYNPPSDEASPRVQDVAGNAAAAIKRTQIINDTEEVSEDEAPAQNTSATGLPTIDGTIRVGETLTADTSGIADEDGLTNVVFSYQWIADDTDIQDATGSGYTLTEDDKGKTITVTVTFTDAEGHQESRTSEPTGAVEAAPNTSATGQPTISGTVRVGETLTADVTGIADEDGLNQVVFSYQWIRNDGNADEDIAGATGSSYTLVSDDEGKTVTVTVSFTDAEGNPETLTSDPTGEVAAKPNSDATGAPAISGTAQVGQTLTANVTGIADEDGLDNAEFTYQWIRNDGTEDADIPGATGSTHTPDENDVGKTLKVRVSFTDDADHGETLTSPPTAAVTAPPLTATLDSVPASHDGSTEFTFELHFSEEFKLSYTVLRDDAFTVTGGTVSRATRVDKGFNIKREIHVQPDGDGAVTIVLPVTTDCADDGAICTVDGRKLSTRLELTVSGPGGAPTTTDEPAPNTSATGQPTISGTVQVGETLTADTSEIADEDGLTNPGFTYQWARNDGATDTDIQGATASTYTLVSDDEGKTITVTVSFTDAEGNPETLTSDPTGEVAAKPNIQATGQPTISGTIQVGETLTADVTGIADEDGLDNAVFSYQWMADDTNIQDATGSSYTLVSDDESRTIKVTVSFTDAEGNPETLTSEPTGEVAAKPNIQATGQPTISGTTQVGETLTADTSEIADEDGLDNVVFSYQWARKDGATDTDIQGATASTYTLVSDDEGKTITVTVSFTDAEGNPETLTSDPTGEVAAKPNTQATGAPTISGTVQVGETLTADVTGIADADGLTTVSYSYQWMADDTNIQGATDATYTLAEDDEGKAIKVLVSFADDAGNPETLDSDATGEVEAKPNTSATGVPTIDGTAQVGQTLTADTSGIDDEDGLNQVVFSYQWIRNDGNADEDIAGATGSSYTLTEDDEGTAITVTVSFTDAEGNPETLTSDPTGEVAAKPNTQATGQPTISGTVRVGETLTADVTGIADEDGLTNAVFSYQWMADDTNIQDATGSNYTLVSDDEGKTITVTVSFADGAGNPETLDSDATGEVEAKPNTSATGVPTIDGTAQVGQTLTADTSGIDDEDGLTDVVFSYQWARNDGNADEDIAGATGSSYTLTEDDEGKTVKVTVSFTDDSGNTESLPSDPTGEVDSEAGPLTGFTLVDAADPDQAVLWKHQTDGGTLEDDDTWKEWTDGGTLTLGDPDNGNYGITVETESGKRIASVRLELTGDEKSVDRTDDAAPYSLFGDEGEDALHGEGLPAGSYTLKARAYTEDDEILGTLEISFSVVAVTKPGRPQDLEGNASAQGIALTWKAPAGSAVTHYVVYRAVLDNGQLHGKPMTRYATIDAAGKAMAYIDADAEAGVEYRYRVAAANSAGEGKKSNWINIFSGDS